MKKSSARSATDFLDPFVGNTNKIQRKCKEIRRAKRAGIFWTLFLEILTTFKGNVKKSGARSAPGFFPVVLETAIGAGLRPLNVGIAQSSGRGVT